jgi:hypothetical protein
LTIVLFPECAATYFPNACFIQADWKITKNRTLPKTLQTYPKHALVTSKCYCHLVCGDNNNPNNRSEGVPQISTVIMNSTQNTIALEGNQRETDREREQNLCGKHLTNQLQQVEELLV